MRKRPHRPRPFELAQRDRRRYPPTLRDALERWAAPLDGHAPFVVVGLVRLPEVGWLGGVMAMAENEMAAHRLRREFSAFGEATVCRTEWHPDGATFDVTASRDLGAAPESADSFPPRRP